MADDYGQDSFSNPDTGVNFDLILRRVSSRVRNCIFSPPRAENEKEKNLYYVIRQLLKLEDIDDEQIENLLTLYPISKNQNLKLAIEKVKNGNPSENRLSRDFSERFRNKLNFCHTWGKWLIWDNNHWKIDNRGIAIEYIRQALEDTEMPDFRRKASTVKGIEYLVQTDPFLSSENEDWDQNPWLLSTPNGTINLKTGKLRISYQEDKITKITSVATKRGIPKLWLKFLHEATLGNKEYISYLQRVSGYCLTGSVKEEALFFLYGEGGNGKGTFLNTLTDILGDYAIAAPMGTFVENKFDGHPTELAMLRGARLVTAQETQEGKAWNEVRIKALTGGDLITARFMREDFFNFIPTFKLLIAGNHEPTLKTVDDAIRRRLNKLPFIFKPIDVDKNLKEKLKLEYEEILNWCVEGCVNWQSENLNPPNIVVSATNEYFEDQNIFPQWLEEFCDVKEKNQDTGDKLFNSWCLYAAKKHFRQGTDKTFKDQMLKNGLIYNKNVPLRNENREIIRDKDNKIKYTRGYDGVQLRGSIGS